MTGFQGDRFAGSLHAGVALALVAAQVAPLPLPGFASIGLAPAAAQRTQTIQCYSRGNEPNSCRLPQGTQNVRLVQDRTGQCREGRTWQQRGDDLMVRDGCGGTFEVQVYGGGGNSGWGGSGGSSGGGNSGGGGWGGSGSNSGGGEIICRSRDGRTERCEAYTENRVRMVQQLSNAPCVQGRTWNYDRNGITVRDGCQARFSYGSGNSGGGGGGWGGGNSGGGFAGTIECRSENNRYQRCSVNTQNRVEIVRQLSNTQCYERRNWGYDRGSIWVDNGCSARFGYGFGNDYGSGGSSSSNSGGGGDASDVIAGVALAGGLVALLAALSKNSSGSSSRSAPAAASGPAALDADIRKFPQEAQADAQACLNEAARQVGTTGGTRVQLNQVDMAQRSGQGWMFLAKIGVTYDGKVQPLSMDCRSTAGKVTAFDVR